MGGNGRKNPANQTDKRLISKIYKQLIQLNIRKTNSPTKKWAEDLNRLFPKEDIQMAINHLYACIYCDEKMLNITHYQRTQIKTTMRYHLTPVRTATIKKSTNNKCWRGCGEKETLLRRGCGEKETLLHGWWEC